MATVTRISLGGAEPVTAADIQSYLSITSALYAEHATFFADLVVSIRTIIERAVGISLRRAVYDLVVQFPFTRHGGFPGVIAPVADDPDKVSKGIDLRRWFFPIVSVDEVATFESVDEAGELALDAGEDDDYVYSPSIGNWIVWGGGITDKLALSGRDYIRVRVTAGPADAAEFKATYPDIWLAFMGTLKKHWEAGECMQITLTPASLAILASYRKSCN